LILPLFADLDGRRVLFVTEGSALAGRAPRLAAASTAAGAFPNL